MNISKDYQLSDRMCDVISAAPTLLRLMSRFGIPLGVADHTVEAICEAAGVDAPTFLTVANFATFGGAADRIAHISVKQLAAYLRQAHGYFLQFQLPAIRRHLIEALDCADSGEVSFLILKFYDEMLAEVRRHMAFENNKVLGYVDELLQGHRPPGYDIERFTHGHHLIGEKLKELKHIIIKYYAPTDRAELLHAVLFDLFTCEDDLRLHCAIEDELFVPAVSMLEATIDATPLTDLPPDTTAASQHALSQRECEIVKGVVAGLSNKAIGEQLFISPQTVMTHRKNIARKLDIHSTAALTIYAIVNGLIPLPTTLSDKQQG